MAQDLSFVEQMKSKVGLELEPRVYEIEKGMIQRFARAIGDTNPLWQDEDYARKGPYAGIIAPPTFILTTGFEQIEQLLTSNASGAVLHGSTEIECYHPVKPGDAIAVAVKIASVRERQGGQTGAMAFIAFDITYTNQRREMVARCRQMVIAS
ncbi:MAG: MaoC family dehydratase N-terminal domain-containing protein [Chloroflexi bacterium]|nr:MaoC family dehydratase N-terminal domain-containing protein [Chloroflexota bacterium]